jgi:tyrosine-protein kinase Etk/Wzc
MLKRYILLILKNRKLFFGVVFGLTLLGLIISLLLPKWYLAEASFLAPELAPNTMIGMGGGLTSVIQSFTGQRQMSGYSYMAILNSRTINEKIVRKFDLMKVYHISDSLMSKALKKLSGNVSFTFGDNDETTISVYDKNPVRAAEMANYYLELLNERGKEFARNELASFKKLIEERVRANEDTLKKLGQRIKTFQEREQVPVVMTEQVSGLDFLGELYAQRIGLELQQELLKENYGPSHPLIASIKNQLHSIDRKIDAIPNMTVEYLQIYRELLVQRKIAEVLIPMLEQVKLSELQKIPDVIVLDKATPPDRKSKPKRVFIVLGVLILAIASTLYFLLIREKYHDELEDFWNQAKATWKN